jgi:hypothetical protein
MKAPPPIPRRQDFGSWQWGSIAGWPRAAHQTYSKSTFSPLANTVNASTTMPPTATLNCIAVAKMQPTINSPESTQKFVDLKFSSANAQTHTSREILVHKLTRVNRNTLVTNLHVALSMHRHIINPKCKISLLDKKSSCHILSLNHYMSYCIKIKFVIQLVANFHPLMHNTQSYI